MAHVPIRVSTLRGDQKTSFDVYIKINDKFLLYLRQGDSFEGARLKRLREKKLRKMYILPEHEKSYRDYVLLNLETAYDPKSEKPLEIRTEIVQGYQQSQTEELMEAPQDKQLYDETKSTSLKFADFFKNQPKALDFLLNIENDDGNIAHHGVNVAALASGLCRHLKIEDPLQLQFVAFGALLHDIEHVYSKLNVARAVSAMSAEEVKLYHSHPTEGARRVGAFAHFEKQVMNIITEHEEYVDGKGFPQGMKESQLDKLSIIVGSANVVDRKLTFEKIPRRDIGKNMMMACLGQRPLEHLQFLAEMLAGKA